MSTTAPASGATATPGCARSRGRPSRRAGAATATGACAPSCAAAGSSVFCQLDLSKMCTGI